MSFVEEEDILQLTENMIRSVFKTTLGVDLARPFPRIGYEECIEKYGVDKPDLRFALEIRNLEPQLRASSFAPFTDRPAIRGLIAKHAEAVSRSEIEKFPELFWTRKKGELTGGIAKYITPEIARQLALEDGDLLLVRAGPKEQILKHLGEVRLHLADRLRLRQTGYQFLWVRDFPLFEYSETDKQIQPAHHIFTMIHERDLGILDTEPLKAFSYHYDLVLNGWEVASGSIRVHNRALQEKLLSIVGISREEASRRYGFLLDALEYGAPPHGGIAVGYDRLLAIMAGRDSIRDVIAFPKTTQAQGLMEGTPSEVPEQDLKALRIRLDKRD
jgi:aspartyl-tRNA synthetase